MLGSLVAGVAAGYLSHIPHNLSTLKLMDPSKSYLTHFNDLAAKNSARLPQTMSSSSRSAAATALTLLMPAAIGVRTTQIVGSFMILNGTIVALKDYGTFLSIGNRPGGGGGGEDGGGGGGQLQPVPNPAEAQLPPAYGRAAASTASAGAGGASNQR
jgi:hypothetical protein